MYDIQTEKKKKQNEIKRVKIHEDFLVYMSETLITCDVIISKSTELI